MLLMIFGAGASYDSIPRSRRNPQLEVNIAWRKVQICLRVCSVGLVSVNLLFDLIVRFYYLRP